MVIHCIYIDSEARFAALQIGILLMLGIDKTAGETKVTSFEEIKGTHGTMTNTDALKSLDI